MKINRLFSIAAATMMMVACSSEDTALKNTPAAGPQMQFTATIAAPGSGATTRTEYTEVTTGEAAGTISVAWKENDKIALIHNGVKDVATVKTVNADGSATITGFITKANNGDGVEVCYPAELWDWDDNTKGAIRNATFVTNIGAQGGTLNYIQENLDVRMAKGELKVDGDNATLSASVKPASQIAIWKLTLQDDAETPAALSATQVTVKVDGTTPVTIASTTEDLSKTSTVYLAMDAITNENLTIEATVGEATYSCTNEGVTLGASKYYQSTVTLKKPKVTDLSTLTGNHTAKDGETLKGTLGGNYKISIADGATVTLDGVTINGENDESYNWAGITCEGDATIILKDGTTNTVNGFHQNYPGIYVPSGKTLTIKGETAGTGSLTAICQDKNGFAAGIGGNNVESCGNIVIAGGTITATGGCGAGIGSGPGTSCGAITISGGTVTATGGNRGAGIGSGDFGTCGAITISGGTVSATGGAYGAGIGSSQGEGNQSSTGKCGDILISGGTVSATGGQWAAGIGSGDEGTCGNITITTGVTQVTATRDGGFETVGRGGNGYCGTVTIGCTLDNDGKPVGGKTGTISTSPYTYDPNAPATITVTWNNNDITGSGKSFTKGDVTINASYIDFEYKTFYDGGTFTTTLGNFTKIEVTGADGPSGTGWSESTWTGTPASTVSFSGSIMGSGNTGFVFTIVPTN